MKKPSARKNSGPRFLVPTAVFAAGVVSLRLAWKHLLRRSLPSRYQKISVTGLDRPVEILRDSWGVPHIYAQNEHDLFLAQGFVHAQDRLFQLDINRRVGSGKISEIVGRGGLLTDRVSRYFGWGKAIQAQVNGADSLVNDTMSAYSAGVNAYIDSQRLPPEFALLRYKPQSWGLPDTAAIGTALAWGLSVNWETELLRAILLQALGPDRAFDLTPMADDRYATVMPDSGIDEEFALALIDAYRQAMNYLPLNPVAPGKKIGSNNWVVNGARTISGRPILANDPHLPPMYPALWYENHLVGGDYNVTGFTMPGIPGVVIGHNEHVAWGFTNAFPDIQDIYLERFHASDPMRYEYNGQWLKAELCEEIIPVRGGQDRVEHVRYTRHGPVFSDMLPDESRDLSLRWALHSELNPLRAVLNMNLAGNWPEFRESLRSWGFPSQNIVYADVHGEIGYMMPGKVPVRRRGAGLVPVPGWDNSHEWTGWIPFEELPALHNPESGLIVSANNRVHGASYPHLLTGEWLPDYRARRIRQLLDQDYQQTLDTHKRVQADTVSLQARQFLALALPELETLPVADESLQDALQLLRQWDGHMRADLVAPSIYSGWIIHFSGAAIRQAVGLELAETLFKKSPPETFQADPFLEIALDLALQWLENGPPAWVGDIKQLLLPALRKTILLLQREFGEKPQNWVWVWGNLHQIIHEHPLTRVPGLGRPWKTEAIPVGGDGQTVNQADYTPQFPPEPVKIIASCRLIMDVGAWDNSLAVLPGGQSGQPASPHYKDGLLDWREGRYHPLLFSRSRVESAVEAILQLFPLEGREA